MEGNNDNTDTMSDSELDLYYQQVKDKVDIMCTCLYEVIPKHLPI